MTAGPTMRQRTYGAGAGFDALAATLATGLGALSAGASTGRCIAPELTQLTRESEKRVAAERDTRRVPGSLRSG